MDKAVSLIGKNITAVQGDASKLDDLDGLYKVVRKTKGHVDIVFANAGVVDPVTLAESTPEAFDRHFNVNARGAYFTVQKVLPLLADKASIILAGSAAWQMGVPGFGAYSATKAALVSFVQTWTAELASRGIRANVISPGPTETPMVHAGAKGSAEGTGEYFRKMIPMGRLGTADEIASGSRVPRFRGEQFRHWNRFAGGWWYGFQIIRRRQWRKPQLWADYYMKIGVIGAGNIGSALAGHFHKLQHIALIANSRGPETLSRVAEETGATPVAIPEAAKGVDLLTIPMKSVPSLPKGLLFDLPAASPIIDTGNYYPLRDGAIADIDSGMTESEWTSRVLGHPVIKVFNNITADSLLHKGLSKGLKNRIALPVSGDVDGWKQLVFALVDMMGFDVIDAGPLSESWRYQPGTPAYCSDPTVQQLPLPLRRAERNKAAWNRDHAAKIMAKLPPGFPPQELVRVARLSASLDTLKPRSWIAVLHLGFAALWPQQSN